MGRKRRTIPWLDLRGESYYVFWTDEETGKTKRLSLRTTDSMEAQQRYAAFLARGHEIFSSKPGELTVRHALAQYKQEHVAKNVIDRQRARNAIEHMTAFFGDRPLSEIDIPASRGYASARRETGVVDSTIRRELACLVAAANHARRWKRITHNEMPSVELPAEARREASYLTKDELRRVIDTCTDARLKAFIQIAYYTAGRRKSIERLRKEQIDLRQSRINLRAPDETTLQRKSKKRRPIVPLFPEIRPVVERLMVDSSNELLFGDTLEMHHRFKKHLRGLGLGGRDNLHILRHSRATHLLQDGVPIYDVARLLGDTIAIVDRVYGHHSPDHLAETLIGKMAG